MFVLVVMVMFMFMFMVGTMTMAATAASCGGVFVRGGMAGMLVGLGMLAGGHGVFSGDLSALHKL